MQWDPKGQLFRVMYTSLHCDGSRGSQVPGVRVVLTTFDSAYLVRWANSFVPINEPSQQSRASQRLQPF
jgi:hypothetical protein